MAGMKYRHFSKVYQTSRGMTKYLSTYKLRRGTARRTVPRDTLYKTNGFSIAKTEAILPLVEPISKDKSPYRRS